MVVRVSGPAFRAENHHRDERTADFHGNGLSISVRPQETYPYTHFRIKQDNGALYEERLLYSHLGLARLLVDYHFDTVLEIGSRNGVAATAMTFAGKKVTTCEILDSYGAEFSGDYLDLPVKEPFDAIWCSHVLEHQRYLGRFLDKMYDDLREGGVLAVTVPSALSPLIMGHCNIFTVGHLIYHLILAGFDCSEARAKVYDWQISVLVAKKPNGVPRVSPAAENRGTPGVGFVANLLDYFPEPLRGGFNEASHAWAEIEAINWPT